MRVINITSPVKYNCLKILIMKKILTYTIYTLIIFISIASILDIDIPYRKSLFKISIVVLIAFEGYYYFKKSMKRTFYNKNINSQK